MKFEVNITKGYFFAILAAFLVLGGIFFVYAYGTNNPQVFGHSIGELSGIPTCGVGEALTKVSSGNLDCVSIFSPEAVYDSGWITATANTKMLLNHGLGKNNLAASIYVSNQNTGYTDALLATSFTDASNNNYGIFIQNITSTAINVSVGALLYLDLSRYTLSNVPSTSFKAFRIVAREATPGAIIGNKQNTGTGTNAKIGYFGTIINKNCPTYSDKVYNAITFGGSGELCIAKLK